jgi:hypothetical protein
VLLKNTTNSIQNPQKDEMTDKDWFISPVLNERKSETASYGAFLLTAAMSSGNWEKVFCLSNIIE